MIGQSSVVQLWTWLHVSEYGSFRHAERWYSLQMSPYCFSCRNVFQNGVKAFSDLKKIGFTLESLKFCTFLSVRFCSNFTIIWSAYGADTYQIMYGETFKLSMSVFTSKMVFRSGILCYHYWCWLWKSLHSSFDFGPHAGEIWTKL